MESGPVGALKDSDGRGCRRVKKATTTLRGDFTCPSNNWDWTTLSDDSGKAADDKPPRCSKGGDKGSSSLLLNLSCILLTRSSFEGDSREDSHDNVEPMDNKWKIL